MRGAFYLQANLSLTIESLHLCLFQLMHHFLIEWSLCPKHLFEDSLRSAVSFSLHRPQLPYFFLQTVGLTRARVRVTGVPTQLSEIGEGLVTKSTRVCFGSLMPSLLNRRKP